MTRKTQSLLFWTFFVVFVAVSPLVVLRARGYRFDLQKRKFVATGAIFAKSDPPGAVISVDGVPRGETSGAFKEALTKPGLIPNVIPGEHDVRVERQGFVPWIKRLMVRPREVSEARGIVLIPEGNLPKTLSFTPAKDALVVPDGSFVALLGESSTTGFIRMIATESGAIRTVYEDAAKKTVPPDISLFGFSSDTKTLFALRTTAAKRGASTELMAIPVSSRADAGSTPAVPPRKSLQTLSASATLLMASDRDMYYIDGQTVWQWAYGASATPTVVTASCWGASVWGDRLYSLEGTPAHLYARTLAANGQKDQLSPRSVLEAPEQITLEVMPVSGDRLMLFIRPRNGAEGTVAVWSADATVPLRDGVRSMALSPDGKKVLLRTWNELFVYYLEDVLTQPRHLKGETVMVGRFGTGVKDARWHPTSSEYVIYVLPEGLYVIELDDRGPIRNNALLVRNGTVRIVQVTNDSVFFTANDILARYSLLPEFRRVTPTPTAK